MPLYLPGVASRSEHTGRPRPFGHPLPAGERRIKCHCASRVLQVAASTGRPRPFGHPLPAGERRIKCRCAYRVLQVAASTPVALAPSGRGSGEGGPAQACHIDCTCSNAIVFRSLTSAHAPRRRRSTWCWSTP